MEKPIYFSKMPLRISVMDIKNKSIHYHPNAFEMLFVIEGSAGITVGQRSVIVGEGECIALDVGRMHSVYCTKKSICISLYFDYEYYCKVFPELEGARIVNDGSSIFLNALACQAEMRNYFIRLVLMHYKNTTHAQMVMLDLVEKMVRLLFQRYHDHIFLSTQLQERYHRVLQHLNRNYLENISVENLAKSLEISSTRLAHFWKDATGSSIRQTLTQVRLDTAEKLLLTSHKTISEILVSSGFSDEKYFYHHFKKRHQMTPNEFRALFLKQNRPSMLVRLSHREIHTRFRVYAMKYYTTGLQPSILGQTEEELQKEMLLEHLYNAVIAHPDMLYNQVRSAGQLTTYLHIAPGRALLQRQGEYQINWEYVYAVMHMYLDRGLSNKVLIDYDQLDTDSWKPLLINLVEELKMIWGGQVVEAQSYLICTKIVNAYTPCLALAKYLQEKTPIKTANAIFVL